MKACCDKKTRKKAMGAHYTPTWLADVVAAKIVRQIQQPAKAPLRILDPACGGGILMDALLKHLAEAEIPASEAWGVDADGTALEHARAKLVGFSTTIGFILGDFLYLSTQGKGQLAMWDQYQPQAAFSNPFDAVIANPPYVRTQVLGADRSRGLAERFGLSGRVDLYHAFLVATTRVLRPGGVLGVITSNRFLTTDGAATIREFLLSHYEICELIDLGDTKVFEAAVLPAVLIGKRRDNSSRCAGNTPARFVRMYMESEANLTSKHSSSPGLPEILARDLAGTFRTPRGVVRVTVGQLPLPENPRDVWSLASDGEDEWVRRVREAGAGVFEDVGRVRVGIKTTADDVFVRSDWHTLPETLQPEDDLLRPLLRHENARRWHRGNDVVKCQVLYPHEVLEGRRRAVDLGHYPRAEAYLESNRERLEKRRYVAESGRKWYEIWVPQDPDAWKASKIVFPDISPEPRFYVDHEGNLVDGDCYWISLRTGVHQDVLYLLLAVANSRLMVKFHEIVFNNRLYSGRRRYITQYVSRYPFPPLDTAASREIVQCAKRLVSAVSDCAEETAINGLEERINMLVEEAFGLKPEEEA